NFSATTNGSGVYSVTVPAGTYSVTGSAASYTSSTVNSVVVSFGAAKTQNFNLVFSPTATYDATLKAPKCLTVGASCESGTLLVSRGSITPTSELNAPNTINNSCGDGTLGNFHLDESLDRLKVSTVDGTAL